MKHCLSLFLLCLLLCGCAAGSEPTEATSPEPAPPRQNRSRCMRRDIRWNSPHRALWISSPFPNPLREFWRWETLCCSFPMTNVRN